MAGTSTDYLLQQLLTSNEKANDNLSAMRDLLSENLKKNGSNNNNNNNNPGNGNNRRKKQKISLNDALKNISRDVSGFSRTLISGSADVGTVTNSLGTGMSSVIGTLGKAVPAISGVTTAFQLLIEAGLSVYNYLNQQLDMYNKINSSGVSLSNGMNSIRAGSANALMSMDKFGNSVIKHADVIAQLNGIYGDGVKEYGDLLGTLQLAQDKIGLYGVSQEQMADLTARNIKFQKQFGGAELIRQTNQEKSTQEFIKNMTTFSKSMGESVDAILKKTQDFDNSLDARGLEAALENWAGLSNKAATLTTDAFIQAAAGMGDAGKSFFKIISSQAVTGALPTEYMTGVIAEFAEENKKMFMGGITDAKEIRSANIKWVRMHKDQIKRDMMNQVQLGNIEAANFNRNLLDLEASANDPKNGPKERLAELTNRFNNWIGNTFIKPFNLLMDAGVTWLLDISDKTTSYNQFITTVYTQGIDKIVGLVTGFFKNFPVLSDIGKTFIGDSYNTLVDNVGGFIGNLVKIPIQLISVVTDIWNGNLAGARETVQNAIASFKQNFLGMWEGIKDIKFSFSDVKDRLVNIVETLKNKLINAFDILKYVFGVSDEMPKTENTKTPSAEKPKNENINTPSNSKPTVNDNNRKQPQVDQNASNYTPPTRVDEAQDNYKKSPDDEKVDNNLQPVNYDESMVELLGRVTSALEKANEYNVQNSNYLRTISDNTQIQRNS